MAAAIGRSIGQTNANVQKQRRSVPWLWEGVLAVGAVTLLSAPEKVGKTTLLSLLLDRLRAGGELLGRTVWPGKTLLCTEENVQLWALRQPPLDFGPDLIFRRPFRAASSLDEWDRFIGDVFDRCLAGESDGVDTLDLLVIDTAVSFLPLAVGKKQKLRAALSTLSKLTDLPLAVLVVNQSRNVHRPLAAFADIVIEMTIPRSSSPLSPSGRGAGGEGSRRRIFTGVGRYPETLQTATAELNPEGTDYVLLPDSPAPHSPLLSTLQTLLTESPTPLTCRELLDRWPAPAPRPDSLWRTLARGTELGHFVATGKGTKSEPFRFAVVMGGRKCRM